MRSERERIRKLWKEREIIKGMVNRR